MNKDPLENTLQKLEQAIVEFKQIENQIKNDITQSVIKDVTAKATENVSNYLLKVLSVAGFVLTLAGVGSLWSVKSDLANFDKRFDAVEYQIKDLRTELNGIKNDLKNTEDRLYNKIDRLALKIDSTRFRR